MLQRSSMSGFQFIINPIVTFFCACVSCIRAVKHNFSYDMDDPDVESPNLTTIMYVITAILCCLLLLGLILLFCKCRRMLPSFENSSIRTSDGNISMIATPRDVHHPQALAICPYQHTGPIRPQFDGLQQPYFPPCSCHNFTGFGDRVDWGQRTQYPTPLRPRYDERYQHRPQSDEVSEAIDESMFGTSLEDDIFINLNKVSDRSVTITIAGKLVVYITRNVDSKGALLILDDMGISLRVPPKTVPRGESEKFSLVLNWDLSDNPKMTKDDALVSPVVYCGPHGRRLNKPCTLSYKHCAFKPSELKVLTSQTELISAKDWNDLREYSNSADEKCVITNDECQLNITHFSLFTSIQTPYPGRGKKWLQIAVFWYPMFSHVNHYQVRMYFLNKTPCALQWAIQNEDKFGGVMCCPEKVFLFSGDGDDMLLRLHYLSDLWTPVDPEEVERIPYMQIWHGLCPHVSMCFRQTNANKRATEINFSIHAYQANRENEAEKLVVQSSVNNTSKRNVSSPVCVKHPNIYISVPDEGSGIQTPVNVRVKRKTFEQSDINGNPAVEENVHVTVGNPGKHLDVGEASDMLKDRYQIPQRLRQKLSLILNPVSSVSSDWRELAVILDHGNLIRMLEGQDDPMGSLLDDVEAKHISLSCLYEMFKRMSRYDAAQEVEEHLNTDVKLVGTEHNDMQFGN